MNSVLHITYHEGTKKSINTVCSILGYNVDTIEPPHGLYINEEEANTVWNTNYKFLNKYDIIITSDTCMVSRPFLQNMNNHNMIIIVYITNRIDWGLFGFKDSNYLSLFGKSMHNYPNRVKIISDNEYDMMDSNLKCNMNNNLVINPVFEINNSFTIEILYKWFILNRGTNLNIYTPMIKNEFVVYDNKNKYKDFKELQKYIGCLHIPYQVNIQTIHEAWVNGIIFVIPSMDFFIVNNFYWEESHNKLLSLNKSVWYSNTYSDMFEYFNSWDECNAIFNKLSNIAYSKQKREFILNNAIQIVNHSLFQWNDLLKSSDTLTLVSMFYKIGGDKRRSITKYLELAKTFLLQLPYPLIIYSDDIDVINFCIKNRKGKLQCIQCEYNKKYIDKIKELQNTYIINNGNPSHETPEYVALQYNKFYFMENSIKNNPFNTEYFGWIDFGINHVANIDVKINNNIHSNKIIQMCINPLLCYELNNANGYKNLFNNIYHHLAGGIFIGHKKIMIEYCKLFFETVDEILYDKLFWQLDEAIMTIVSCKYPHMFDLYYGDYDSIISNNPLFFSEKLGSTERIKSIILKYINSGDDNNSKCVVKKITYGFPYLKTQFNRFITD
jgi:hypothetical protein